MSIAEKLAVSAILIAGGMVYLAEQFNMPQLIPFALGIFGVFALILGAETFIEGKIQLFNRLYSRREHYAGLSARLLGAIIFLFGVGIVTYTAWDWIQPGKAGDFLTGLVGSNRGRGILLIAFGFFTLLFGLIRMIAGSAHNKDERQALVDVGFRMRGLVNFVVGILLIAIGTWLIFMTR
jgi:hypothetical protein